VPASYPPAGHLARDEVAFPEVSELRSFRINGPGSGRLRALLAFVAMLATITMAYGRSSDFSKDARPQPARKLPSNVSMELDAPALCEKLSPSAIVRFIWQTVPVDKDGTADLAAASVPAKFLARVAALPSYH